MFTIKIFNVKINKKRGECHMTSNERVKFLRKEELNLTQEEFGKKLGVSRDVIKNLELSLVDVKDYMVKLICLTFNVREEWLKRGKGSVFKDEEVNIFDLLKEKGVNDIFLKIIKNYISLPKNDKTTINNYIKKLLDD